MSEKLATMVSTVELQSLRTSHSLIQQKRTELELMEHGFTHLLKNLIQKYDMPPSSSIDLGTGEIING